MLQLLLILPLIGSLILFFIPEDSINNQNKIKNVGLSFSILNFIISIFLWYLFDNNTTGFQFVYEFTKLSFCHFNIGVDGISIFYVLLTTFITPIALASNY